MLVAASMPLLFVVQQWAGEASFALAFQPATLSTGGWWPGLLTSMFLHANWPHVLMNATGALAFGAPVARLLPGARGAATYLAFYIACGLVAALGYGLVHPTSPGLVVGASGASPMSPAPAFTAMRTAAIVTTRRSVSGRRTHRTGAGDGRAGHRLGGARLWLPRRSAGYRSSGARLRQGTARPACGRRRIGDLIPLSA